MRLRDAALARLDALMPDRPPVVAAVSGGGDSMALLRLLRDWTDDLHVVTVDHGLRAEAAAEAQMVARRCADLGVAHATLHWRGWQGDGNLQDAARQARRHLIEDWAMARGIDHCLTGHTADDQAETLLLRLARGSGVDGLAAMRPVTRHRAQWLRPLLDMRRDDLRAYLRDMGESWIDDPSNEDDRFDRIRARKMLSGLADLGLTAERLQDTARHMQAAQDVLDRAMHDLAAEAVTVTHGDIVLNPARFAAAPDDTKHRLLAAGLCWVSGAAYRPRFQPLRELATRLEGTLHGCRIHAARGGIHITREWAALSDRQAAPGEAWDDRWIVTGPDPAARIAALGENGLSQLPKFTPRPLPAASLVATPAVWRNGELLAAPVAGWGDGWHARLAKGRDIFPPVAALR